MVATDAPSTDAAPRGRRAGLIAILSAEAISQIGTKMSFVALPWLVLVETGSPTRMGLVAAAEMLPYVLVGVIGAPLIDRLSPWRIAIDTDLISAVAFGAIVASYQHLGLWGLVCLVFVAGGARGLGDRARAVLLRPQIDEAGVNVTRVTAIYDGIGRLTTLIGAPVGGILIALFGSTRVLGVDAVSFGLSAIVIAAFVRPPPPKEPPPSAPDAEAKEAPEKPKESYLGALRGGVDYLRHDRLLIGMLLMLFVTNLCNQAHQVVFIPLWVNDRLGTPAGLGVVFGSFGLGALTGNLIFTALAPRLPRYLTLTIGYIIGGAPRMLILALSDTLPVVVVVLFLTGVALSSVNPIIGAVLYQRVPTGLQARVFGLTAAIAYAGLPIGSILGGWAASGLGLTTALVVASIVAFLATLSPLLNHRVWREVANESVKDAPAAVERPPLPLTVTLAYANGEWRVGARRGRTTLIPPSPIEPAQALRHVSRMDLPEARAVTEEIIETHRVQQQAKAERLRAELAEVEARLEELDGTVAVDDAFAPAHWLHADGPLDVALRPVSPAVQSTPPTSTTKS